MQHTWKVLDNDNPSYLVETFGVVTRVRVTNDSPSSVNVNVYQPGNQAADSVELRAGESRIVSGARIQTAWRGAVTWGTFELCP